MATYDSIMTINGRAFVRVKEHGGEWVLREATEQEVDLIGRAYAQASAELGAIITAAEVNDKRFGCRED